MQVRRLLEPDDHITISLPPLFIDIVIQVPRESAQRGIRIGAQLLKVVHTEGNDVFVGCQKAVSLELPDAISRLAAQQGFNLLRDDRSPEHPGKRVADGRLELALDARSEPLLANHRGYPSLNARPHLSWHIADARQTTRARVGSPKHGIGTPRRCGTVGILRIASVQFRIVLQRKPKAETCGGPLGNGWGAQALQ